MDRRKFIITCSSIGTLSIAGCMDPAEQEPEKPEQTPVDSNSTSDGNPSGTSELEHKNPNTDQPIPVITNYSFEIIDDAPKQHQISSVKENTYTIEGSVAVPDGCTTIELGSPPSIGSSYPVIIRVQIPTVETDADMCTQAVRNIGYRLKITVENRDVSEIHIAQQGVNSGVTELQVSSDQSTQKG